MSSSQHKSEFQRVLRGLLTAMGALPTGEPAYESRFMTRAGKLLCQPQEDWLATRFENPGAARAIIPGGNLNPHSGKWNWHSANKKPGMAELKEVASLLAEVLVERNELKECGFDLGSTARPEQGNIKISYMYRDADNYKAHGEVVLAGRMSEGDMKIILAVCSNHGGRFFIPGMVGLDDLQKSFNGGESEWHDDRDHPWHTFTGIEPTEEECTHVDGLASNQLVDKFLRVAINRGWDESYKPESYDEMRKRAEARVTSEGEAA
jgi:hypothetical protein